MNRERALLVPGLIGIIVIVIAIVFWGPASGDIYDLPELIFSNSEAVNPGEESAIDLRKPAGGERFELVETIEIEGCWHRELRPSEVFVIHLTSAQHEQSSTVSHDLIGDHCYRLVTTGRDIAELPGVYDLQVQVQKAASEIVMGSSDSRIITLLFDGSLIMPTPTNTSTPTAPATGTATRTPLPFQTPTVRPTRTPQIEPTLSPTATPRVFPTSTPSPTQIPPTPTNLPPPPPDPKPTSLPPPPATATAPPPPPPPKPTDPPPPPTDPPPPPTDPPPPPTDPPPKATPTPP